MDDKLRRELTEDELAEIAGGAMMRSFSQEVKESATLCLKCGSPLDTTQVDLTNASSRVKSLACPSCHQRNYFKLNASNEVTQIIFNQ